MKKTQKLVLSALFAALICVATAVMPFKIPGGSGYIHPGDGLILIGSWLLGPVYGFFAAAIGSALADLFAGYPDYALVTFVVKGLMAFFAAVIFKKMPGKIPYIVCTLISALVAELIMVGGYFSYEYLRFENTAFVGVPANLIQGASGIVISIILYALLSRNKTLKKYFIK